MAYTVLAFLNQMHLGLQPVHTWFLEIVLSMNVDVCVCVSALESLNNKSNESHA